MKWLTILAVAVAAIIALAQFGFVDEFLGPWAKWANWIGYFQ